MSRIVFLTDLQLIILEYPKKYSLICGYEITFDQHKYEKKATKTVCITLVIVIVNGATCRNVQLKCYTAALNSHIAI